MIGGTSTGGLIALLLGRLRLSVSEAINTYRALAKQVFSEKNNTGKDGTFKASNLERAIKETIELKLGEGHADDKMIMSDNMSENCKTFVCAVSAMHINGQPTLFRTWLAKKNPEYNCTIWEAARATSAAPTFFERIYIGDEGMEEEFIDGGLGCNNPVRYLVKEAANEFGPNRKVSCIVSIGTGKPMVSGFKAPGIFQRAIPLALIDVLKKMATDSQAEASRMEGRFRNCPRLYHRLNVEHGLQMVSLEEWAKLGEVRTHTKTYLKDDTVSQGIDVIVDALVGRPLETFPLDQLDGAVAASVNANCYYLYPSRQVTHYVARSNLVETIRNHIQRRPDNSSPTIAVLHGMGGCGKTQVALEYCRQGQNYKWFSAIFWFDASSPTSMEQSFADAAHKLSKPNFDIADAKGNIQFVLNAIETRDIYCLLVFDNFDDPKLFSGEDIKVYFPRGGHVSILFTTRDTGVTDMGKSIDVTFMLGQEALELLLRRSHAERSDANMQEGRNIVKRLGYHALAIDQAGAYIAARGLDLDLYMVHYLEREEKVLSEIPELWDYRRKLKTGSEDMTKLSVFTTWELSVHLITGTPTAQKDKIHLLTLAAFLDSKEVSDDLFECYGSENIDWLVSCVTDDGWDKYEVQGILKELRKLSLLQNLHVGKNETTFSLHPLIQDWVKMRIKADARQEFALEAIILLSAFLKKHDNDMTLIQNQALLSHLEVSLQNDNEYRILQGNLEENELQYAAMYFYDFLDSQGRHNLSEQTLRYILTWKKATLGEEHPSTLQTMNNLGATLQVQGKYDEAMQMLKQTLQLRERFLEKDDPDKIDTMSNLGLVLYGQGKYYEAEKMQRRTLLLRKKSLGKDHPETLSNMNNLGAALQDQGKHGEAEQIHRQVLGIRAKVIGSEHPDTLTSMHNLGISLHSQCKHIEAEPVLQQALQLREKILGNEHPDTLTTISVIGADLGTQGKYYEAEQLYRHVLQLQEKILGSNNPSTLRTMNNLGVTLKAQGKYDEANSLGQQVVHLAEKVLGKEHPDTITYMRKFTMAEENLEESEDPGYTSDAV